MQYGNLMHTVYSQYVNFPDFHVGDGVTICHWSDRTACTVVSVSKTGKTVVIQEDKAVRTDKNGMSEAQDYDYFPDGKGALHNVRKNKKNQWRVSGSRLTVIPGRDQYYDFSF